MNMLTLFNTRERDSDGWRQLLSEADQRLVVKSITKPQGSNLSFIHIIFNPI